jgi:hypothetical protein
VPAQQAVVIRDIFSAKYSCELKSYLLVVPESSTLVCIASNALSPRPRLHISPRSGQLPHPRVLLPLSPRHTAVQALGVVSPARQCALIESVQSGGLLSFRSANPFRSSMSALLNRRPRRTRLQLGRHYDLLNRLSLRFGKSPDCSGTLILRELKKPSCCWDSCRTWNRVAGKQTIDRQIRNGYWNSRASARRSRFEPALVYAQAHNLGIECLGWDSELCGRAARA